MPKKIVISHFNNTAAVLYNNKIQELCSINSNYQVNDIYLGSIHNIFSSINAAFVNLGNDKKSGFIHMNDVKFLKRNYKLTRIADILSINQLLLVQVVKEPTLNKGPRLTANINLFGRYLVLMPFCNTINISRGIYDKNERSYLYALAVLLKPSTMGLLVRSAASGVSEAVLVEDLRLLKKQWYCIQKLAIVNSFPCLLYKDEDLVKKIVRDLYDCSIHTILSDSSKILNRVRYYLSKWHCISVNSRRGLKLLKQSESLLDKCNMSSTIKNALEPKVDLSIGGYLFIETYEAFTIIDVNSGSFNQASNSRENVLRLNCYAATEIAYQMRFRNINGIIVVDFIDMESYRDQLQLLEHFARVLSMDNAKPQIIQISKLGLVELTRRRREQSLFEFVYAQYNHMLFCDFDNMLLKQQEEMKNNDLVYKNINYLFFGTFFSEFIYVYNFILFNKDSWYLVNFQQVCFADLNYILIVPLTLYSHIVSFILPNTSKDSSNIYKII